MTAETSGPVAMIDKNGNLTVDAKEPLQDGRLTLLSQQGTTQAVTFLFRALRASSGLRIVSMVPIRVDETEVVLDLGTPNGAARFLSQLRQVFVTAEERVAAA